MKWYRNKIFKNIVVIFCLAALTAASHLYAQDSIAAPTKAKPVKNTFSSVWLIDNQTVIVPTKGTLEFDIQHRFGVVSKGKKDVFGILAPANIRLALGYVPWNKLMVGAGLTKERTQVDFNIKYALVQQTKDNSMPVSSSYFGNVVIDAREKENFLYGVNRFSYFHQLILARKFSEKISMQVAPSFSWVNNVEAYIDENGDVKDKMQNGHFAIAFGGGYNLTPKTAIIANYDQPLTQHFTNNPRPNLSLGLELSTSSHTFQIFGGNYYGLVPQSNNFYNQNDYTKGQFLIGFNITRLWNF